MLPVSGLSELSDNFQSFLFISTVMKQIVADYIYKKRCQKHPRLQKDVEGKRHESSSTVETKRINQRKHNHCKFKPKQIKGQICCTLTE